MRVFPLDFGPWLSLMIGAGFVYDKTFCLKRLTIFAGCK